MNEQVSTVTPFSRYAHSCGLLGW